jgi:type IV secretion system protein TrbL
MAGLSFGLRRFALDLDIALNYFKTVVAVGASLMTMVLIVGVGKPSLTNIMRNGRGFVSPRFGTMLVFAVVLLALVNKVPAMVGAL